MDSSAIKLTGYRISIKNREFEAGHTVEGEMNIECSIKKKNRG
jgi:hypothetical protein